MEKSRVSYKQLIWLNQLGGRTHEDAIEVNDDIGVIMNGRDNSKYFHAIPNDEDIYLKEVLGVYDGLVKQVFARIR